MRAKTNVAVDKSGFDWWKLPSSQIHFAKKFVNGTSADTPEKHTFGIDPAAFDFGRAGADEYRARCAECDQFIGVDRQIVRGEGAGIFQEVARHPVIFAAGGNIFHLFSEVSAVEFSAAFSR